MDQTPVAPGGLEPRCPKCGGALRAARLAGADLRVCVSCKAALVARIDLAHLLEAVSHALLGDFDADAPIEPVARTGGTIACPICNKPMTGEDYCGAGLVQFDCCETHGLLWLGGDQIKTMTLMWARMDRRAERTHRLIEERLDDTDFFVDIVLRSRWMY